MYPVNDYLIVKEVGDSGKTTVSMPKSTMLQLPPVKLGIKKYEIVKVCNVMSDEVVGSFIAADVRDVRAFFDGTYVINYKDIIAMEDKK